MKMIELNYNYNDFKGLSEETMKYHYEVLYKGYVDNYNKVLEALETSRNNNDFANIKALEKNLSFQGAGAVLHQFFFENITPKETNINKELLKTLEEDFGSYDLFKDQFINNMINIEGSGWGILGYSKILNKLIILQAEKHQDQTIWDFIPLLVLDMWEHAYYLDYKTNKKAYAEEIFSYINWDVVYNRLKKEV